MCLAPATLQLRFSPWHFVATHPLLKPRKLQTTPVPLLLESLERRRRRWKNCAPVFRMTRAPIEGLHAAVFLDRDGTIMRDVDFCSDPRAVEIFDGVVDALQQLKRAGFKLFVITNQSGIGRGYFTEKEYRAVEDEVERKLGGGVVDASYFCPDAPDVESRRRKPSPEMVFEAAREHNIDLGRSFFVGDKAIDVECGQNAGLRTVLVKTGYGETDRCAPTWIANNLIEAVKIILREQQ